MNILSSLLDRFHKPMLSPIPENQMVDSPNYITPTPYPSATPTPTPTPTPVPKQYRSPIYAKNLQPKPGGVRLDELLSGTKIASEKWGQPQDLIMDIMAIESSGGQFPKQMSGGPGRGPAQFEVDGEGKLVEDLQRLVAPDFDVYSATDSADLVAQLLGKKQLSRWGTPKGNWGSLNNKKNTNGKLTDWYSTKELDQYLTPTHRFLSQN
jgi:hypothetical protein